MMSIPGFANQSPVEVTKHAVKDFIDDDMMTHAASLAFRVLLAIFPFIIVLLSLLGALGRTEFFDWLVNQAQVALPPQAAALQPAFCPVGSVCRGARPDERPQ